MVEWSKTTDNTPSADLRRNSFKLDGLVKSRFTGHCEESRQGVTTKQSPDFKQLHSMRLLRYARNDCMRDFLRDHQTLGLPATLSLARRAGTYNPGPDLACKD